MEDIGRDVDVASIYEAMHAVYMVVNVEGHKYRLLTLYDELGEMAAGSTFAVPRFSLFVVNAKELA